MSRAYKCDRCGKLYEYNTEPRRSVIIHIDEKLKDLCPDCYKQLRSWLKCEEVKGDAQI